MNKKIFILILLFCVIFAYSQVDPNNIPYFLEVVDVDNPSDFKLNSYSLVHNVYMSLFYQFNLYDRLGLDDKVFILSQLHENFKKGQQVNFMFRNYQGDSRLFVRFEILNQDDKQALLMRTNYQIKTKEFVSPGDLTGDWENFLAFFFYWDDSRLANEDHRFKLNLEKQYNDQNDWLALADLYLFDEKRNNDPKILDLLNRNLKKKLSVEEKFLTEMTFCEYYLMNQDVDSALKYLKHSADLIEKNHSLEGYRKVFLAVADELEILSAMMEAN